MIFKPGLICASKVNVTQHLQLDIGNLSTLCMFLCQRLNNQTFLSQTYCVEGYVV